MALDRQSIEKKDFPVGRRGYDPEAVDTHLTAVADEVAELKRDARKRSDTVASSASEQVRAIVEAAEASAAQIQSDAEAEAREIREEAASEAKATKEGAIAEARDYVGKVSESTNSMLKRLDAMETELSSLIESLRTGSNRLSSDLELLEGELSGAASTVAPRRFELDDSGDTDAHTTESAVAEPDSDTVVREAWDSGASSPGWGDPAAEEAHEDVAESEASAEPEPVAESAQGGSGESIANGEDTEGARLIALNMALNGTSREETEKYLLENFQLSDTSVLLDEVYASVEG